MSLFLIENNLKIPRKQVLEPLEERIVLDAGACADSGNNPDDDSQETSSEPGGFIGQAESVQDFSGGGPAPPQQSDPVARIFSETMEEVLVSSDLSRVQTAADSQPEAQQDHPNVLVVSSTLQGADQLLEAAQEGVFTVLYDGGRDGPDAILSRIEQALAGCTAQGIAFATHDLGEGKFHLSGGVSVSPGTLVSNDQLSAFWQGVGSLVTEGGRIDILACELASTESGRLLISQLEQLTGRDVAASDDPTGNPVYGGDWVLETGDVDLVAEYFDGATLGDFSGLLTSEDKVTASDGALGDSFGWSVSLDGYWAVAGAPQDDDNGMASGAAYIYHFEAGTWVEYEKLTASDGGSSDLFGRWVAIDGEWAVVGAEQDDDKGSNSGSAYMFHFEDGTWVEKQKLTASDGDSWDRFGGSGDIDGNCAIIGASYDEDKGFGAGAAYVFQLESGVWVEQVKLLASDGAMGDAFGRSIDIEGDYAVIGAPQEDANGSNAGAAYVFHCESGDWVEQQKLLASDGTMFDQFGSSVSISGDYVFAGAPYDHESPGLNRQAGAAYVYQLQGDSWIETQRLIPADSGPNYRFGISLSVGGEYAVVGAYQDNDSGLNSGSASLFHLEGGTWVEVEDLIPLDGASGDRFGYSVSTDGVRAIVGSYGDDDQGANSGSAYVYGVTPPEAGGFTITANEDTTFAMTWWHYLDPQGDAPTAIMLGSLPENATVFLDSDGDSIIDPGEEIAAGQEIDWSDATTNGLLKFAPDADWFGTTTFRYCVKDSLHFGSSAEVTINLNPVNDGPQALPFSATGEQGSVIVLDGWGFTDVEGDDPALIRITGFETSYGDLFLDANSNNQVDAGELIVLDQEIVWADATANGLLKFAASTAWYGSTTVTYTVSDGSDFGAAANATIVVEPTYEPPVAGAFTVTGQEDTAFHIEGWNSTVFPGYWPTLVKVTASPHYGTLFLDANGNLVHDTGERIIGTNDRIAWSTAVQGLVAFEPSHNFSGSTEFTYCVADGTLEFGSTAQVTINVIDVNDGPDAYYCHESGVEDTTLVVDAWDYWDPEGDAATMIRIVELPENGVLFLDANANDVVDAGEEISVDQEIALADATTAEMVKFAPDSNWFGSTSLRFCVKDHIEYGSSNDLRILVANVPDGPVAGAFHERGNEDAVVVVDGWNWAYSAGHEPTAVQITSAPYGGVLFYDLDNDNQYDSGERITSTSVIDWTDATSGGMVKFLPYENWHGTTTLT